MAIMISFKLGKRQNRGSRAPIMIDRVSRRSARVLLCLALVPRRLMCDLHVICKTWNRHTIPISSNHYIHMPRPFYLSCITAFGIFLPLCGGVFPLSRQVGGWHLLPTRYHPLPCQVDTCSLDWLPSSGYDWAPRYVLRRIFLGYWYDGWSLT